MAQEPRSKPPKDLPPIDDAQVVHALEASGYPLEVTLFNRLKAAGLDPTLGHRFVVGNSSKEVDLLARVTGRGTVVEHDRDGGDSKTHAAAVTVLVFMDAKKLHGMYKFVGILGEQPSREGARNMRALIEGIPSYCALLDAPSKFMMQMVVQGELGAALDPFGGAPVCAHWGLAFAVEEKQQGKPATHVPWFERPDPWWEAFDTLVRTTAAVARDGSRSRLDIALRHPDCSPLPGQRILIPTVVIDTEHDLKVYDPATKALTTTTWLTIHRVFDVGDGELHGRAVDVVSVSGFDAFMQRMKKVEGLLPAVLQKHGHELLEDAREQQGWHDDRTSTSGTIWD